MSTKIDPLIYQLNSEASQAPRKNPAQETKDQFLQMLIAQLKNQDPLNPVSNDRFAVDLATFSQLEQLISMNEKLSAFDSSLGASANLLGKTVILKEPTFNVSDGRLAEDIFVDVDGDFDTLKITLKDSQGNTVYQTSITDFKKGRNLITVEGLNVLPGSYAVEVVGEKSGLLTQLSPRPAVTIHGFVPGNPPTFISGSRDLKLDQIAEIWQV